MTAGDHAAVVIVLMEWALTIALTLAFCTRYAWRSDWRATPTGRNVMAFMGVHLVELVALLLIGVGVHVPAWFFPPIFGVGTLVVFHRLVLLVRAQRAERSDGEAS